jgi:hypothetical protein
MRWPLRPTGAGLAEITQPKIEAFDWLLEPVPQHLICVNVAIGRAWHPYQMRRLACA